MEDRVLRELGDELMRLTRLRTQTYPGSVLETSAFRILWRLTEGPPRTQRELAEELQLEQSTVTRQVNAAIGHGLVERYAVAGSSARLLRPTEAGRAAYLRDGALRAAVYGEVLDELGPERARSLVAGLRELNDRLDRAHSRLRPEPPEG
jgi:DNA-binding MarR family transcriptional regulator